MSTFGVILIILAAIVIIFIIFYLLKKKDKIKSLLELSGASTGVIFRGLRKDRRLYLDSIETIIKGSEKLNSIINNSKRKEEIYAKLLQDQVLVEKLKKSNNVKEIEKILTKWLKDNNFISKKEYYKYSKEISKDSEDTSTNETIKRKRTVKNKTANTNTRVKKKSSPRLNVVRKVSPRKQYSRKMPGVGKRKLKAQRPAPQTSQAKKVSGKKSTDKKSTSNKEISPKTVEYYEQIIYLLESGKIDQILDILKKLSAEQLREIISHFQTNVDDGNKSKFDKLLSKSKTPTDITHLLHLEAVKSLEDEHERIKDLLSNARRKGVEIRGEELDLYSIPHKIKMFKATFDKKDFYKVRDALIKIEKEILVKMEERKSKL